MEDISLEFLGLVLGLLTTLIGLIPGIWALVRQFRKDVKDAETGSAEAVRAISQANEALTHMWQEFIAIQKEELEDLALKITTLESRIEELEQALDLEKKEKEDLIDDVKDLIEGIEKLIKQIEDLGHVPTWRPKNGKSRLKNIGK